MNTKHLKRSVFPFLTLLLIVSGILYSCNKNDFDNSSLSTSRIAQKDLIQPSDVAEWFSELPIPQVAEGQISKNLDDINLSVNKLPFLLHWEKAEQRILNGKHTVRVPISKTACMVFIKEKEGSALSAYFYKWEKERVRNQAYSGKVVCFSFQDYKMQGQVFRNGRGSSFVPIKITEQISLAEIQRLKKEMKGGYASTKSWLGDALRAVGNLIGALGCIVIGGEWDNGSGDIFNNTNGSFNMSCSDVGFDINWGSAVDGNGNSNDFIFLSSPYDTMNGSSGSGSDSSGSGSSSGIEGGYISGSGSGLQVVNGSGSTDLNSFFWTSFRAAGFSSQLEVLSTALGGLTLDQKTWLEAHADRFNDLFSYMDYSESLPIEERRVVAKAHLEKMISDSEYYNYVESYSQFASSSASLENFYFNGASTVPWWENSFWLGNNLTLVFDRNYAEALGMGSAFLRRYQLEAETRNTYPQFASLVDNIGLFLSMNPKVMDALVKYTGFTKEQINVIVIPGNGPLIKLVEDNITTIANGYFNAKVSTNTLFLSKDNVNFFENNPSINDRFKIKNALAFSLLVTILHETVHYGRFQNGLQDPQTNPDMGTNFEELGFGFNVEFSTDQKVNYKIYYLP